MRILKSMYMNVCRSNPSKSSTTCSHMRILNHCMFVWCNLCETCKPWTVPPHHACCQCRLTTPWPVAMEVGFLPHQIGWRRDMISLWTFSTYDKHMYILAHEYVKYEDWTRGHMKVLAVILPWVMNQRYQCKRSVYIIDCFKLHVALELQAVNYWFQAMILCNSGPTWCRVIPSSF